MHFAELMENTLLLDLETTRSGKIRHIGAVFQDDVFEIQEKAGSRAALESLDNFGRKASFILGHNLLGHDFPLLKAVSPWLGLLDKPVIDTLYLSPLAFPENPYHHLVKDYKLVRSAINSPVEDARLAGSVFQDQWNSFAVQGGEKPALLDFYRFCFQEGLFHSFTGAGIAAPFSMLSPPRIQTPEEALTCFIQETRGEICEKNALEALPPVLLKRENRPVAAYCIAWLQVAGGNSVLPPWVRHGFQGITALIKKLRMGDCGEPGCAYCATNNNPELHLERFFGFPGFRKKPETSDHQSLQRSIVAKGMQDQALMGILPTGGGKSLCYQLPALVRYERTGALTVVISPLQALMKDQVDNLVKKTGTLFAEAVTGSQTPLERGEVFERIRLGDTAILYISPEQLRNQGVRNILRQREIGCWVFDEAHCLSKWGHDFRPDYLYAARFIREFAGEQNLPVPPVCCFTATAKTHVIEEISDHFREELDLNLLLFLGEVGRDNLSFEVVSVSTGEKLQKALEIVGGHLQSEEPGSRVIVYAATRDSTEELQAYLNHQGIPAEVFHAGLEPRNKREIMEAFVDGDLRVICATNAFGMGIDKENVRLVLHYEMPGSLENYIQEAGRAGRDLKPARCILLYDPLDANLQFGMTELSRVTKKEISRILRVLRRKKPNSQGEIVVTTDDLLQDDNLTGMKKLPSNFRDTKMKTAIAWLERAGFLERNQNQSEVFQGKALVKSLEEAKQVMDRLPLDPVVRNLWLNILNFLFNSSEGEGIRADELGEALFPDKEKLAAMEQQSGLTAGQMVIVALHDMADARLLDQGILLSATFRPKGVNNAMSLLSKICELENKTLEILQEEDPDADNGFWVELDLRRLSQKLENQGLAANPDVVRQLIKGISYDGKGLAASKGSFEISHIDRVRYQVRLQRTWKNIKETIFIRQNVAHVILQTLLSLALKSANQGLADFKGDVEISFSSKDLSNAIRSDITLAPEIKNVLAAMDRALMFLHEQKIITLQGGLAILRQAMTIRLNPRAKRRYYNKADFEPLAIHYMEKRFQVHVMIRYAMLSREKIARATQLVLDYFSLGRLKFLNKYFEQDKDIVKLATTAESFRAIVEKLRNPVQISAVASPVESNLLILAGPGSGKTTVIIHRCAYLLEVERIPASQILVLCFNHNASVLIKKRLKDLVGRAAKGVTVVTYHGAAMRLTGVSIRDMMESGNQEPVPFGQIIRNAISLLKGEKDIPGIENDEMRERLIAGYSHILVDEYQDIDEEQYDLVSAIAGRTLEEEDGKLTLMAVGDDDQNIYSFRGANVRFIQKFQEDYGHQVIHLIENYRSSKHIIAASNALIRSNKDRMKKDFPIVINKDRMGIAPGGSWEHLDLLGKGRVQIVSVRDMVHQAVYLKNELDRIKDLDPGVDWKDFGILSRTRAPLSVIRRVLEKAGYPLTISVEEGFSLHRVREVRRTLEWLISREKDSMRASQLRTEVNILRKDKNPNIWWEMMDSFFEAYQVETEDSLLPVSRVIDGFYEYVAEQRREKLLGRGIFLSTIHSAKGMEFSHVFVLDGDWNRPMTSVQEEEERRLFYVAMTRAKETLHLLKIPSKPNPFLKDIRGDFVLSLTYRGLEKPEDFQNETYELLGLDQIYLDYAGRFPESHSIHSHLAELETSQRVSFHKHQDQLEIHTEKGHCVARLSKHGVDRWTPFMDRILEIRVVAMLFRENDDPDESYRNRIKARHWELPVLEVVYSRKTRNTPLPWEMALHGKPKNISIPPTNK